MFKRNHFSFVIPTVSVLLVALVLLVVAPAYADSSAKTTGKAKHSQKLKPKSPNAKTQSVEKGYIDYRRCKPGVPCGTGCCPHGMRCGDSKCVGKSATDVKDPISPEQLKASL